MPRKTSSRRTPVSRALIELRSRMGETQQSLSALLGCSLQSVARWETTAPPVNMALANLHRMAAGAGHHDLAKVFMDALEALKGKQRRKLDDTMDEINRWHEITDHLRVFREEVEKLRGEKLKDTGLPERMEKRFLEFETVLAAVQRRAWRANR